MKLISGQHIPWREQLDLIQTDALTDEDGWLDDIFEALDEGGGGQGGAVSVSRVNTPMPSLQRQTIARHTASASSWDSDFEAARAHAADLMSKIG